MSKKEAASRATTQAHQLCTPLYSLQCTRQMCHNQHVEERDSKIRQGQSILGKQKNAASTSSIHSSLSIRLSLSHLVQQGVHAKVGHHGEPHACHRCVHHQDGHGDRWKQNCLFVH